MRFLMMVAVLALLVSAGGRAATPQPAGGSMQRSSVEGCAGTQLFNGIWRVKVMSFDPAASYNDGSQETGVGVKLQLRNGTHRELAPDETGFSDINGNGIDLAYADENTVNAVGAGTGLTEHLLDKKLPPGGASTVILYFPYGADKTAKPAKLLIAVDQHSPHNTKGVKYSVKSPSFRVDLTCGPGSTH